MVFRQYLYITLHNYTNHKNSMQDQESLNALNALIPRGERARIAAKHNVHYSLVSHVLSGIRNRPDILADLIESAENQKKLIEANKQRLLAL